MVFKTSLKDSRLLAWGSAILAFGGFLVAIAGWLNTGLNILISAFVVGIISFFILNRQLRWIPILTIIAMVILFYLLLSYALTPR